LLLAQGIELVHAHPRRLGDRAHRPFRLRVAEPDIGDPFGRKPVGHVGHGHPMKKPPGAVRGRLVMFRCSPRRGLASAQEWMVIYS
jgi:hypothetical protein